MMMTALLLPSCRLRGPPALVLSARPRSAPPSACAAWEDLSGDGGVLMRRVSPPASPSQVAAARTFARVHYRAALEDGTVLSDSHAAGETLELRVGMQPSEGVLGWDLALPLMSAGDAAMLRCEPQYAFGEAGAPPHIPPNATIVFDLKLLGVRDVLSSNNTETVDFLDKYSHIMAAEEQAKQAAQEAADAEAGIVDAEAESIDWESSGKKARKLNGMNGAKSPSASSSSNGAAQPPAVNGVSASSNGEEDGPPTAAQGGRGWIPQKRSVEVESAKGYSWRETDEEIEVRIPLPSADTTRADLAVSIGSASLRVAVLGEEVLSGELCGKLLVDESSWSLEREDDADAGVLQLDLMKKEPTSRDEPLWGYLLKADREATREDL